MNRKILLIALISFVFVSILYSQNNDKIIFKEYKPGFYQNSILKDINEYEQKSEAPKVRKYPKLDVSSKNYPVKADMYKSSWHNPVISQGNAGTCWAYATTSFYETEVYRLTKQQIKLSEIHTVYWEYIEKAKRYIKERGNSAFGEGSQANAVTRIFKLYGAVPQSVYSGLTPGLKYHSHAKMFDEMETYLKSVKSNNQWNEEIVISTIKAIMNNYIGTPPSEFDYNGKKITPKQYLTEVLKLKMDDYVDILSIMQEPFWTRAEYEVTDNWWHSKDYYNVPLEDFMKYLKIAVKNGYSTSIGGDVSEAGLVTESQIAVIPTFDIPSEYIDDNARQFRFSNKTTTDDHGMHLVGWVEKDGKDWFLIKDSSAGSRNNSSESKEFGYYFFHEDFIKLKMMNYTIHKDAVKDLISKFK